MSGFMGGGDITNTEARVGGLQLQQSSHGVPIALVWGRARVSPNLLWMDDFEAVENRTSQQAGKGGGTTVTTVTYTYRASLMLGLKAGYLGGIRTVWRHKDKIETTTRTLPAEARSHTIAVPANRIVSVPYAYIWGADAGVALVLTGSSEAQGDYNYYVPTSAYTVAAGVYTFGASIAPGTVVRISYTLQPVIETLSALQNAGFSQLGSGALGQPVWSYLTTAHPQQAIGYSGIGYVVATKFTLGGAAGLPQLAFEVDAARQASVSNPDASPADIAYDLLTDPIYGAAMPAAAVGSLATYRAWCAAAGLWLSPVWAERKGVFEYITQLAKLTYAQPLWSVNQLKLVPLSTQALVSSGGSYTPAPEHAGPVYAITDDDIAEPIDESRRAPADRFNRLSVRYRNRSTDYADAVESAEDRASIDAFGLIEAPEVMEATEVTTTAVAAVVAELQLRDSLSAGSQYRFTLPVSYDLLEPLDIVQIEDARIDLAPRAVRIIEISEAGDDGSLQIVAEDVRTTGAVVQARQVGDGYAYTPGPPGAISVRAVMMPTAFTGNTQQLWLGVAAGDNWGGSSVWVSATGSDYRRVADINVRARLGTLTSGLPVASTPLNPGQSLSVALAGNGAFASVDQADFDANRTPVWVNGEVLTYRDAILTAPARYTLSYLRRGQYGTAPLAQSIGAPWMRLDDTLARIDVPATDVGSTLYIKVTSRNALGTYVQGLEEVAAIPVVLTAQPSPPGDVPALALTAPFVSTYFECSWQAAARASDYEVQVFNAANTLVRTIYTSAQSARYLYADAVDDGGAQRSYTVKVRARNVGGNGPWASLPVSNPAPAVITGVARSGSGATTSISWAASAATDLAGYIARYSTTTGFNPAAGQGTGFYDGNATSAPLAGLTVGTTVYVRVAAYDVWDKKAVDLNWSAQLSFVV